MAQGRGHPKPGDLIEIFRPVYQHWAIYVGDGYVIHVTDEGDTSSLASTSSISATRAKVKKQLLEKVAGKHEWCVNNKYDRSHTPLPVEKIIQRAEELVGKVVPYNVFTKNCEHFVTKLRYGIELSDQVEQAKEAAKDGATSAAALTLLTGAAALALAALLKR
ncbi:phospholipase A and acyltransferase 3-like isoform X1 [Poecile atricapillus]|uniref:phospholipase A and acyltransferase 3-like isoform X1 n=1 Tax=Poecile atricapillus TaxID=48891 RepID=UPI00273A0A17|nr:phospholipase A and acyltransferase 3-like isoform X1 [Poecile atricapillus]